MCSCSGSCGRLRSVQKTIYRLLAQSYTVRVKKRKQKYRYGKDTVPVEYFSGTSKVHRMYPNSTSRVPKRRYPNGTSKVPQRYCEGTQYPVVLSSGSRGGHRGHVPPLSSQRSLSVASLVYTSQVRTREGGR